MYNLDTYLVRSSREVVLWCELCELNANDCECPDEHEGFWITAQERALWYRPSQPTMRRVSIAIHTNPLRLSRQEYAMIDDNDLVAVERYIESWHRGKRVLRDDGTPVFDERTENEFIEEHLDRVDWTRMWARKAGILANEKDAKETRQ